jgi:hypothetical protein
MVEILQFKKAMLQSFVTRGPHDARAKIEYVQNVLSEMRKTPTLDPDLVAIAILMTALDIEIEICQKKTPFGFPG